MKKIYLLIILIPILTDACKKDLVSDPSISQFTINQTDFYNGDTVNILVDAQGDYIVVNTPFEAISLSENKNWPAQISAQLLDDTLVNATKTYTIQLVVTNVYDLDHIKRTEQEISVSITDTSSN